MKDSDELYKLIGEYDKVSSDMLDVYESILKDPDSISSGIRAKIEHMLGATIEQVIEKNPGLVQRPEEHFEEITGAKYLPGGMLEPSTYEPAIRTHFAAKLNTIIANAFRYRSSFDKHVNFSSAQINLLDLAGLEVKAGKPKIVYHPYSIMSVNDVVSEEDKDCDNKNSRIRDLVSGAIYNITDSHIYDYIKTYENKCDESSFPGSKVNKPVVSADKIFFCPKIEVDVVLELEKPFDVLAERCTAILPPKDHCLDHIVSSEKWLARFDSEIKATYEFFCNTSDVNSVHFDEIHDLHLDFQEGRIAKSKRKNRWINDWIPIPDYVYFTTLFSGLAGLGGAAIVGGITESAAGFLAIPAGLALSLPATGYYLGRLSYEKSLCKNALKAEWDKKTIKTKLHLNNK